MSTITAVVNPLHDNYGRCANYLRISITDRCNFSCFYCRGGKNQPYIPHADILRYEEITRLAAITKKLGVGKLRVTGGEPFARKDCIKFLWQLRKNFPDIRLCVTTNGSLLEPWIKDLADLRLDSVNISLDSFDRATFKQICGQDALPQVLNNIDQLLALGCRVKINSVAIKGITDVQIADFLRAIKTLPIDLRFIEFMPMGANTLWSEDLFLSCAELQKLASQNALLTSLARESTFAGPAKMYAVAGGKGRLGFISPLSNHFCSSCNRMRLTCRGNLRTCLFTDKEYRLAPLLRNNKINDAAIARVVTKAYRNKKIGADILKDKSTNAVAARQMVGIGG